MRQHRLSIAAAAVLLLLLSGYVLALVLGPGGGYRVWRDGWLGNLVLFAPAALCLARGVKGGSSRLPSLCLGLGMLSFGAGNVIYVTEIQFQVEPAFPSLADAGYLGFYPFACAAVLLMLRRRGSLDAGVWLDGVLGAVGAATALAVLLNPVLSAIGGDLKQVLVSGAYPVSDLLLASMIVGTLVTRGVRSGTGLMGLTAGLLCFCTADVIYALRVAADSYVVGTPVDALWAAGTTVMALALWAPSRRRTEPRRGSLGLLGVPLVSTAVAIGVLLWATRDDVPPVTVALATTTLVLAAVRTLVAFRQVQRLADARQQARTDELTGLANRRALYEEAAARLERTSPGDRLALLLIDLDGFKEINDALGHHVGDELLREVAARLAARARPTDTVARLGGDEFAVVIALDDVLTAADIAQRILQNVAEPLTVDGVTMRVGASIGIAEHPAHGDRLGTLLRAADIAMYEAKRRRSGVEVYAAELDNHGRGRLQVLQDLHGAFEAGEFVLHYQPKCDTRSGRPISLEALVRWQHPTRGLLFPDGFLGLVEQSGLMSQLTQCVLATAAEQAAAWRAAGIELPIAVNVSASDLLDEELPRRVETLLAQHELPTRAIEIEITESLLMADPDRALRTLGALRDLGVTVAIDDYGTGHSSLAYLCDLPVDQLKIDRHFVARLVDDQRNAAIVRSTIELAHALGLEVVAEGVEDADALSALAAMGCEWAQGYHFSRPLAPQDLLSWLHEWVAPVGSPDDILRTRAATAVGSRRAAPAAERHAS